MSVWLHIIAAAIWFGGMVFLVLVLLPVLRRPEHRSIAGVLTHLAGVRFRNVGWVCLGLLVLSGAANLASRGVGWANLWSSQFWQSSLGRILGVKLVAVAVILVLSAVHDFVIGPRATPCGGPTPAPTRRCGCAAGRAGSVGLT